MAVFTEWEAKTSSTHYSARKRINALILSRLREGPLSSVQLGEIGGLSHTKRISELRNDGFNIEAFDEVESGTRFYRLLDSPLPLFEVPIVIRVMGSDPTLTTIRVRAYDRGHASKRARMWATSVDLQGKVSDIKEIS